MLESSDIIVLLIENINFDKRVIIQRRGNFFPKIIIK